MDSSDRHDPAPARTRWACGALALTLCVHVWHFFTLPVVMTWDGVDYLSLSALFGTPELAASWHYYRTPAYPFVLRVAMALFGRNALAIQLPNFIYGFGGIALIWLTLLRQRRPFTAAGAALLLTFFPVLVAYEHGIFTETGSFFFLAASVAVLCENSARAWLKPAALALIFSFAFYHRMTFLYVAPMAGALCAGEVLLTSPGKPRRWKAAALAVLLSVGVPFLAAYPYNREFNARPDHHYAGVMMVYGLVKQAVPAPDDPLVAAQRVPYERAIASNSPAGSLDWGGIPQIDMLALQYEVYTQVQDAAGRAFVATAWRNPGRYLRGLARGLVYFAGARSAEDENGVYVREVILNAREGTRMFGTDHPNYADAVRAYARPGTDSLIAALLSCCIRPYRWLLALSCLVSAAGVVLGLLRRNFKVLAFCAIPLALIGIHVVLQITINRYAAPAYPLLLANLLAVPSLLRRN